MNYLFTCKLTRWIRCTDDGYKAKKGTLSYSIVCWLKILLIILRRMKVIMGHARKQLLSIYVVAKCNLKCRYCALSTGELEIDHKHQVIDINFVKRGVLDFFRDYPSRGIRFYGAGEPTMEMPIIRETVEFVNSLDVSNPYFELQTNGFFSQSNAEWIENNVDFVWISFDGIPSFQNQNRPLLDGRESAEVVVRNIEYFGKSDKIGVGVRVTMTPDMIDHQKEIIDFLAERNIKFISVERAFSSVNHTGYIAEETDPIYFAKKYLEGFEYAKEKGIFYNHFNMVNFDEKVRFFCRSCVPYPHLTTDGYVSACDMAQYGCKQYEKYSIPDLVYGKYIAEEDRIVYDEEKIYKIRQKNADQLAKTECKGCPIVYNCAGGCLGQAYNETGKIRGKTDWDCTVTRYLAGKMPLNEGLYPILHP